MKVVALTIGFVFASVLVVPNVAADESSPLLTGKLIGLDTRTQVVAGFGNVHSEEKTAKNGKKVTDGYSYVVPHTQVTYVLTVVVGEMTYTVEHAKTLLIGYNPTDMVVNDPVNVRIEKNKLIFLRPNGKEYKTTIIRMERNPGLTLAH